MHLVLVFIHHVNKRLVLLQEIQVCGMTVPLNEDKELTNFDKVKEFMDAFGQEVVTKPEWPDAKTMELRMDLIEEEVGEFNDACFNASGSLVDIADALSDILYVVYGAGHSFGIDLDKCFDEVHRSNMSKLGEDGKPIYRDDGKVLKGENFSEPNLKEVMNGQ
jgi:predicted HAD superfamily Cof-like phosphohydrolase